MFVHKTGPLAFDSAAEGIITGESLLVSGLFFLGEREERKKEGEQRGGPSCQQR